MSKVPRGIGPGYPNADTIPTPTTLTVFNWKDSVPPAPRDEPSPLPEGTPIIPLQSVRSLTCGGDNDSGARWIRIKIPIPGNNRFSAPSNAKRHMKAIHPRDLPPTAKPEKEQPYNLSEARRDSDDQLR
ncbi:hypothetical protein PC9H_010977 [Pleurotus ostreatus]|uniref:Uncharacterized protein n=2 Tax=Pleurotus ostreatus TaxID=5322 RepID=A0A067NGE8_PLEO1|nr:uncharacterized protein PC9H_010977 [Pleurotus ostreatus]KAF7422818.1 hypothetical protein PC9H_010977 [Pleurotus ostreatus]KDQ26055.1 hypothetical protein PLEOSDRAFT_1085338 [Pleurotus ostreatus PC15]